MPHFEVSSRSRAWPRIIILVLIGVATASCSDSARFDSNPYTATGRPPQDVTGSVTPRPATTSGRVEAQPLPAPNRPATVAANGYAVGAQGLGAYRPAHTPDVTGAVQQRPAQPAGAWTWDGGAPVTVGRGETVETIARRYGVPVSAVVQTNGFRNASEIRPGQRLVIPRYVSTGGAQHPPAPARAAATESVHIVKPGESLGGIARHYGVTATAIARANKIESYAKLSAGDRLTIPGAHPVSARATTSPAPQLAQPRTKPAEHVASIPAQTARMATQEPVATDTVTKSAEAAGGMPSFRWPVRGRVIAGFGASTNGQQNDGINLAVPEGTPVKAADDGVVAYAGNELKGYGNLVLIRHPNGFVSAYAHASELLVKRGDSIKRGQVIAHAGQTGNVTSPQLHFEIRKGSTPVDPTKYLGGA